MLSLLLDENISPVVAEQIRARHPDVRIQSLSEWREGEYLAVTDEIVLMAAREEGLTLVTYDTQILSELSFLFASGIALGGLIFVDDKSIAGNDFGALIRALLLLWDQEHASDWQNRLVYLPSPQTRT
ncbi:MAG TPA: DUF5615 family PIN-like protein [Chthonomonadaceae bacterium]|nr:DUF5615 family PIN-like protein [Chthonomonadaceae bacterium]